MFKLVIMNEQFLEVYEYECKFMFTIKQQLYLENELYYFCVDMEDKSVTQVKREDWNIEEHTLLSLHSI